MLTRETMRGVYVLVPTPFGKNGEFDEESFRENVRKLCKVGMHAIVTTGGQGEFHTITWEDHKRLIKALAEETEESGTMAVAGCSGVSTDEAIQKTKYAEACGVDAVMNVSPYYVKLTHRELVRFWWDLAQACPNVGLIVYNNAGTSQLHGLEVFREIVRIPTICGSKEGHYDFSLWYRLHRETNLAHLTPQEQTWFVPTMKLGAKGVFSMTAAMCPEFILKLYESCKAGDWDKATEMQFKLHDMWRTLDGLEILKGYHAIPRFKAIVNAFGFLRCGITRRPFIPVPDDIQERLTEFVQKEFADVM